jgi:heme/copper-type cytochrome/quinol oxidase subunit 2
MTSVVTQYSRPYFISQRRQKLLLFLLFSLLGIATWIIPWPFYPLSTTRHFILDSSQFKYEPGILRVNKGDTVVITVTASDVVHGLYLDGYGMEVRVAPGQSQIIRFIADRPGKFRYRCSVSCGPLHPFMIGELIVGPNTVFGRAVASIFVVVIAVVVYLWRFPPPHQNNHLRH